MVAKSRFGAPHSRIDFELKRLSTVRATIRAVTGTTEEKFGVFRAAAPLTVTAVRWIPEDAVTGAANDNFAVQAINAGIDGTGTTGVTTVKTYAAGTDSVALTPEPLTLAATEADRKLAVGDVLAFHRSSNGTGLNSPAGVLEVDFEFDEA